MNVIIGMDWLDQFEALIYCRRKVVRFWTLSGGELTIHGEGSKSGSTFFSASRAKKYLQHGCEGFMAYVIDTREEKKKPFRRYP